MTTAKVRLYNQVFFFLTKNCVLNDSDMTNNTLKPYFIMNFTMYMYYVFQPFLYILCTLEELAVD